MHGEMTIIRYPSSLLTVGVQTLLAHYKGWNTALLTTSTAQTGDFWAHSCCMIETPCPWLNTAPAPLPLLIACV